jgi:hypothetical protein
MKSQKKHNLIESFVGSVGPLLAGVVTIPLTGLAAGVSIGYYEAAKMSLFLFAIRWVYLYAVRCYFSKGETMITFAQYVGPHLRSKDWTAQRQISSGILLQRVNALMLLAEADGVTFPVNPKTGSQISGQTFGGFRPQDCPQGAPNSNHKEGKGIDLYDPANEIDAWCLTNLDKLEQCEIWIEHPSKTSGWSHWQSISPRSGNRVYIP